MGKVLARLAIFGILLTGAVDASAQFAPFDSPPMRRLLRGLPQVQTVENLSDRPTTSCSNLRNSVAQILCSGREGAAADWAVNSATWAYLHHVGDAGKAAFGGRADRVAQFGCATVLAANGIRSDVRWQARDPMCRQPVPTASPTDPLQVACGVVSGGQPCSQNKELQFNSN